MQIDNNTVEKVAKLAKLKFNGQELEAIKGDMNKILVFMDKLNELDTEGVEALEYINEGTNVLRADDVEQYISKEEALKNGPVTDSDFFKVPKVLKK